MALTFAQLLDLLREGKPDICQERVRLVFDHLDAHGTGSVTLRDVAGYVGADEATLASVSGLTSRFFSSGVARPGVSPAEYIERLQTANLDGITQESLSGLRGRFCYGSQPSDFAKLGHPKAKTCFIMGAEGLWKILRVAKSCSEEERPDAAAWGCSMPMDLLLNIGYDVLYIFDNIRHGRVTELVVFPESAVVHQPATWHGTAELLRNVFPRAAPYVARFAEQLTVSGSEPLNPSGFRALEKRYIDWRRAVEMERTVPQEGSKSQSRFEHCMPWDHGTSMTEESLADLGDRAEPFHVRAFLCHFCGMNSLFGGDGYTLPEGTVRRVVHRSPRDLQLHWRADGPPVISASCSKSGCMANEMIVRAESAPLPGGEVACRPVRTPEDLPEGQATLVLVQAGRPLAEFLAENTERRKISDLRSTPIGSPTLEMCVKEIANLLKSAILHRFKVMDKGKYWRSLHWNYTDRTPPGVDTATGIASGSTTTGLRLTPGEYVERLQRNMGWPPDRHLEGVGIRMRTATNGPIGGCFLDDSRYRANPGVGEITCDEPGHAVLISSPFTAQKFLEHRPLSCLDALLFFGIECYHIFEMILSGVGFVLDAVVWDPWRPGDDSPTDQPRFQQFPTSREGVAAFLRRYFPVVAESFPFEDEANWAELSRFPTESELAAIDSAFHAFSMNNNIVMRDPTLPDRMTYERFQAVAKGQSRWPSQAEHGLEEEAVESGGVKQPCIRSIHVRAFITHNVGLGAHWAGQPAFHGLDPDKTAFCHFCINVPVAELRDQGSLVTIPMGAPGLHEVMMRLTEEYKRFRDPNC